MDNKNKHKLSRTIPNSIKYIIRKEAYYGCVSCGIAIYEYEHIDPPFQEAKKHDSEKMTILCPTCHAKVTRGFTSKDTVWKWKNEPWGKKNGYCHESFNISSDNFAIWLGASKIEKLEKILTIDDECLLSIKPPQEEGSPFLLSAAFYDNQEKKILEIIDNEWRAGSDVFDICCVSGKIGIRQDGKFVLKIICFPPNQIAIELVDMVYKGLKIKSDLNLFEIIKPDGTRAVSIGHCFFTATQPGCSLFTVSSENPNLTIGGGTQFITDPTLKRPYKPMTSHKFERNSQCPCGKNIKYKNCCSPKYDFVI